uniref:mRNA (guanine-N(7))-methyltransferase n=1 Tax=Aegilops tauschii subsp. strangulata TaxID=200361 RepID=A0A453PHN2_AEGTS
AFHSLSLFNFPFINYENLFSNKLFGNMQDAVDCPEWVVPFHLFKLLAEEYDLELVLMKNFHEFVHDYVQRPEFADLMRRLGPLGDGRSGQSTLSQDEWEASYLYLAFVLRKRGPPPSQRRANNPNRGKTFLAEEDIEFLSI